LLRQTIQMLGDQRPSSRAGSFHMAYDVDVENFAAE